MSVCRKSEEEEEEEDEEEEEEEEEEGLLQQHIGVVANAELLVKLVRASHFWRWM